MYSTHIKSNIILYMSWNTQISYISRIFVLLRQNKVIGLIWDFTKQVKSSFIYREKGCFIAFIFHCYFFIIFNM